jgi:nitrite reductase (NADH) small subunit
MNRNEQQMRQPRVTASADEPAPAPPAAPEDEVVNGAGASANADRSTDHVVGTLSDFPEGSHRVVDVAGRQIGIFNIRGELFALPNVCPHQTGPVCEGKIVTGSFRSSPETGWRPEWVHDGEVIICPWHGLEYHVPSGRCLAYPHVRLRRYQIVVEEDRVAVRMIKPRPRRRDDARA